MRGLKTKPQWVMWKYETVKGKKQKVLYSAMTKRRCGANAKYSKVWVPYEEAVRAASDNGMEGVGFVVPKGYIAFDFDHCVQDDPMLKRAHELLPSYTEKSPGGSGEHIICKVDASKLPQRDGKWDPDYYMKNSHIGAEAYAGDMTSRYVTYTGNEIGTHDIFDCTDGILTFLEEYMRKSLYKKEPEKSPEMGTDEYLPLSDLDIVCIARRAKNAEKFIALYDEGDISGYGSASEADLAECSILAFYAGGDEDTIDRLHREGKLYREKWEREDYRRETIKKAVKLCNGNFYTGHRPMPDFVGFNKNSKPFIICPKLAEYFRNNYRLISVRDGGKGGVNRYLYRDGCYRIIADDMLKGVIKSIIMDTDPCLLQMRDVNEVFQQIITDLNFMTNDQLNTEENLINFANGLLDINTLELLPHDPDVISTIQLPCDWNGVDVPTPVFDRFMITLLNRDKDVIELVLEFMGVCISNIKGWRMKKALFMVGDGDTGKSKLKSLTETLLGKGNHEGIVTDEEFAEANGKMKKFTKLREYKGVDKGAFSVFVCPYCGLRLHAPSSNNKLFCSTGRIRPDTPCAGIAIDKTLAEETVLTIIRKQAEVMIGAADIMKKKQTSQKISEKDMLNEERRLRQCILSCKQRQISLYEKYRAGKMTKEEFLSEKATIRIESGKTEASMAEIEKQIETSKTDNELIRDLPIMKYAGIETYDKRIVASLIEKVEVLGSAEIFVIWKHQDEYDRILGLIS